MYILGIWDGHDSGAALLQDNKIIFAANEERFTRRKLEIKFPYNSIKAALDYAGIKPDDVEHVAFATIELTKTLERIMPYSKEYYYEFRRRKMLKPRLENFNHNLKYMLTSAGTWPLCNAISKNIISAQLRDAGFTNYKLHVVDHHTAHAATAAFTSGFSSALVITLDGLGDGLSGSISILRKGKLERHKVILARNSLGRFFEQVTNIVGMRELEDEGKVMAMADYSFPFPFEKNKLKDFFKVEGIDIIAKYSPVGQYDMLNRIAWSMPREQFAYMAQQLIERTVVELVTNAINKFGIRNVVMAGGLMSNVKMNMKIKDIAGLKDWFVFPQMGDGGLSLGAAMHANYLETGTSAYAMEDAYLGNSYSENQIRDALRKEKGLHYELIGNPGKYAGELINKNNYVFWFQGRMEFGPRALGNRSILANAGDEDVKEKLNIHVKQREWYQPFAPAVLRDDASKLFDGLKGDGRFMTMVYRIKKERKDVMKSVRHIDLTARPQMVWSYNKPYEQVLRQVRKKLGYGVVLNTSFNIHGMPIVMTPGDAIDTMKKTKTRYMFLGDFFVENKSR
ncbi:MAG: carbamoyltransferase C-terminal domain-containing protein [Candidatus Micrarchaeales archaeon]